MKRIIIPVCIAIAAVACLCIFGIHNDTAYIEPISHELKTAVPAKTATVPTATIMSHVPAPMQVPESEAAEMDSEPLLTENSSGENVLTAEAEEIPTEGESAENSPVESSFAEETPEEPVAETQEDEPSGDMEYLGSWVATAYCPCEICCGSWSGSPTASGVMPTPWHTVACDILPFGTEIYVDGYGYFVVEDLGVYGEWIDIFCSEHSEADTFGMQTVDVYLVR